MRLRMVVVLALGCGCAASAQQVEPRQRLVLFEMVQCFRAQAGALDDGKSDARTIAMAVVRMCEVSIRAVVSESAERNWALRDAIANVPDGLAKATVARRDAEIDNALVGVLQHRACASARALASPVPEFC